MKLIQKLIEDAAAGAVGGGDVAAAATPLFAKLSKRDLPTKIHIKKKPKKAKPSGLALAENFKRLHEVDDAHRRGQSTFDTTEVVSKLKSLENKNQVEKRDTQAFVLEDDDGNGVKIWVRADQAANFEAALNAYLSDLSQDEKRGTPEIAEILFKLKNNFDIVDVQWPEVAEDEEQEVALASEEGGEEGMPGMEGGEEGMPELDAGAELGGGEEDVKSLLTQVIDMMKADAEARKAEAHARQAEAKAREEEISRETINARVKQEERILDMEAHEKKQKEADKEAKRLAKLAKWQHDMERDEGESFAGDEMEPCMGMEPRGVGREEEETHFRRPSPQKAQPSNRGSTIRGRVNPADVANFILNRVK